MTVFPAGRTVVDREQVRRWVAEDPLLLHLLDAAKIADVMGALLAELEQAERETSALADRCEELGMRLARVPALVEAARAHKCKLFVMHAGDIGTCPYCETLAEWEQA